VAIRSSHVHVEESPLPPDRRLEHIMGMPITIAVADDGVAPEVVDAAFASLRRADEVFSTYRPESDISRLDRRELMISDCAPEVAEVLTRCRQLGAETDGYFTVRPGGRLDPSGLVKGWAVARAGAVLRDGGVRNALIDAGGDVWTTGSAEGGEPWHVGIRHPLQRDAMAAIVAGRDIAVATSGEYDRGRHIVDPHRGTPPSGLLSVTVVGHDLPTADAYATAIFAMGEAGPAWSTRLEGFEVMCITAEHQVLSTPGMSAYLVGA
jgi:thiamine biosynthesis lipoprotein